MEIFSAFLETSYIPQLLIAMLLGMAVGSERSLANKTAGLRTYGLVSLGSCLFILVALGVLPTIAAVSGADIMRVFAGVITGIGFLGAGAIIFRDHTNAPTGLTTAAGLWVSAGIGIAVGFEQYNIAVATAFLTLLAFTVFWFIEREVKEIGGDENVDL